MASSVTRKLSTVIDNILGIESVSAHCDIPCKIYDPSAAIIAALSVVRLIDIIEEKADQAGAADTVSLAFHNTLSRCILRKEEEAEKVKHEIRVIWGDYMKQPQLEQHPSLHSITHNIMMKASTCKHEINRNAALDLVELVNSFADIFWQTKEIKTERKTCPYPPSLEVVYPVL